MIVDLFINVCVGAVTAVVGLIPQGTLSFSTTLDNFANYLGSQLNGLNNIIPITEVKGPITAALGVYVPFVIVFYTVRWIYSKIPVVGQ